MSPDQVQFFKFIVLGGNYGDIAHLSLLASSAEQALLEWRKYFGEKVENWVDPHVVDLRTRPDMKRFWEGNMEAHYSKQRR